MMVCMALSGHTVTLFSLCSFDCHPPILHAFHCFHDHAETEYYHGKYCIYQNWFNITKQFYPHLQQVKNKDYCGMNYVYAAG